MTIGCDYTGHNLILIVGSPRSGTTWLQKLLASHPAVRTGQESYVFQHIGEQLRQFREFLTPKHRGGQGLGCYFNEEEFCRILKSFLITLLQPMVGSLQTGALFVEKTPAHSRYIPEIVELLPKVRIIHILRDPRDVVASSLAAYRSWGAYWAPNTARRAATRWSRHVEAVRRASKNLPSWQFHEIRYEELHEFPGKVLRECSKFIGLEWSDEELGQSIQVNTAAVAKATDGGTPIPVGGEVARRSHTVVVEPAGFIRKGMVGDWRNYLKPWEKFAVWWVAHKLMADIGYPWPMFFFSQRMENLASFLVGSKGR